MDNRSASTPTVTLLHLNDVEYREFTQMHLLDYARQHINAGEWTADAAPTLAAAELAEILTDSPPAPETGHIFFKAVESAASTPSGWIWISPAPKFVTGDRQRKRWLSQITVAESLRGQGFGRAMLDALHAHLAAQGVEELWLRVYDWNQVARRLYARAGYELAKKFDTDAHLRRHIASP